jgi:hypothetical protein
MPISSKRRLYRMPTATHNPLTRVVKRILDLFRILAIASLILWPLFVVIVTVGHFSQPETWGVDIGVFARFIIDLSAIAGDVTSSSGVRDPIISGKAMLNIDTSSLHALYLFTAITELGGIVGLYVLIQLRALFASLVDGASFTSENFGRIRKIGVVVIGWALISPLLQYFGGQAILAEYSLNVAGIQLSPAFDLNGLGILIGLAMIVLSGVLNEAASMQELQELTI